MQSAVNRCKTSRGVGLIVRGLWVALALFAGIALVEAQTFSSGSDGSDGAFVASGPAGTVIVFDSSQYTGTHVSANIFNFTTITIAAGVTVKLSGNKLNGPVHWLAQGDVSIAGGLDLNGGNGQNSSGNSFTRALAAVPGPGGYAGGVGGNNVQLSTSGSGPGGGSRAAPQGNAGGGAFTGNSVLIPLVGGSGGGGAQNSGINFDPGGGAGGGAILIASSTQIVVTGSISANGGAAGTLPAAAHAAGGSGGAIRLVSNTIAGAGILRANGGVSSNPGVNSTLGTAGRVRLEAFNIPFSGSIQGTQAQSVPNSLLAPTAGLPTARVISIGGTQITPKPDTFPDLTINTSAPVDVVIQTQNIPPSAAISLTVLGENGAADTVVTAPSLSNCSSNVCTTTVQVVFRPGASRGLTRVTWTQ